MISRCIRMRHKTLQKSRRFYTINSDLKLSKKNILFNVICFLFRQNVISNTNQSRKYYNKEIIVFYNLPKKHELYKINDFSINEKYYSSFPFVETRHVFAIDYQWDLPNMNYNLFTYHSINLKILDSFLLIFSQRVQIYPKCLLVKYLN